MEDQNTFVCPKCKEINLLPDNFGSMKCKICGCFILNIVIKKNK